MAASEGGVVHVATWCGGNTIGATATRGGKDLDVAHGRVQTAVDAILAGEPEHAI